MDKLIYDSGFGILPKRIMIDENLNIQSKAIFAYLITFAGNGDTAFPSRSLITHHLKISKDTFTKYLNELKDNGYIEVYKSKREKGKFGHNVYKLVPCPKSPDTVSPDTVSPDTVNQDTNINRFKINSFNKNNVNEYVYKAKDEKLSKMSKLYQENIGMINGIVAEWIIEVSEKIDVDLFKRAIEICSERGNNKFGYLKGIIKNWSDKNITSSEQLKAYKLQNKYSNNRISKNNNNIQNSCKKGAGANVNNSFAGYSPDELEKLLLESQKGKFD